MHFQIADVERPLISVAKLADAGNRVVIDAAGGRIEHCASGRTVRLIRDGNVFVLGMYVVDDPEEEERGRGAAKASKASAASFRRQDR